MPSLWNLLYILPLALVTYTAFKRSNSKYKKVTSAFWVALALTMVISSLLKVNLLGFGEGDNYIFAAIIDLGVIAYLIRSIGFKLITGFLLLGYAAMFYYLYIPYQAGEITLKEYYINLEAIGLLQIFFITWGMYHEGLIRKADSIFREITFYRSWIRPSVLRYVGGIDDNDEYNISDSGCNTVGQSRGSERVVSKSNSQNISHTKEMKPTFGTGPNDYWKPKT